MKNVLITVYDSMNYGSFLQAFALKKVLEGKNRVVFLKLSHRYPFFQPLKRLIKNVLKGRFQAVQYIYEFFLFNKSIHANFVLITRKEIKNNDKIIVGSDEIWNVKRKCFRKYKEFFGIPFAGMSVDSYAPSCNTAQIEDFDHFPNLKKGIQKMESISVRDQHSKDVISQFVDKEIKVLIDPTFLVDKKEYVRMHENINPVSENYILVYSYGNHFTREEIRQIKLFAKEKKLPVYSIGFLIKWCDKWIVASPFQFLAFLDKASYIITDTFHGTAFSVIYEKKFVTFSRENAKVNELVNELNIACRNMSIQNISDFSTIIEKEIDYLEIKKHIEDRRKETYSFLHI